MTTQFIRAINVIYFRLNTSGIKWSITGSTNLQLQHINIIPHDLDIAMHQSDLKKINKLFIDHFASDVKELNVLSNIPAWEVKANICNVDVHFFGGDDNDIYTNKLISSKIILIALGSINIPCFTLSTELELYRQTWKNDKVKLIQKFLTNTHFNRDRLL